MVGKLTWNDFYIPTTTCLAQTLQRKKLVKQNLLQYISFWMNNHDVHVCWCIWKECRTEFQPLKLVRVFYSTRLVKRVHGHDWLWYTKVESWEWEVPSAEHTWHTQTAGHELTTNTSETADCTRINLQDRPSTPASNEWHYQIRLCCLSGK